MFDFSLTSNFIHHGSNILRLQREPAEGSMKPHMEQKLTSAAHSCFFPPKICVQSNNTVHFE